MAQDEQINQKKSIYAKVVIEKGTYFGPYPGKDAIDQRFSEWMSYIGRACSIEEANLITFPENGQNYYKTIRQIQPFETFLVWDNTNPKFGIGNGYRLNHQSFIKKSSAISTRNNKKRNMELASTILDTDERKMAASEISSDVDSDWIETENSFFACPECGEEYVSLAGLALHRVQHLQDRTCVVCSKIYRREEQLNQHLLSHPSTFCAKCVELFGGEFSLDPKPPYKELRRPLCMDCDSIIIVNNVVSVSNHEKKKRTCGICGKTFATPKTLLSHVNKHNNKYCCKCCKKSFGTYSNLVRHLSTGVHNNDVDNVNEEKKYNCEKCGMKFKWNKSLVEHECRFDVKKDVDKIKEEDRQRCSLRRKSTKKRCCCCLGNGDDKQQNGGAEEKEEKWSLSELPQLSRNNSRSDEDDDKDMPILCRYDQEFDDFEHSSTDLSNLQNTKDDILWSNLNSKSLRNRQINLKNGCSLPPPPPTSPTCPTVFICHDCPQVFTSEAGLTLHQLIHFTEEKCCACGSKFSLHRKLQHHLSRHSSDDIWNCFRCQMLFGSQFSLEFRDEDFTSTKSRYPLCLKCDELICINSDVKATMTMKSQNRDGFECRHCGVVYTDRMNFNAHLNRHLKKFSCKECKKCFGSYENLARHVIAHTDYFPYKCETCKQKFKWKSDSTHSCEKKEDREENGVGGGVEQARNRRSVKKKSCFCCVDVTAIKKEKIEDICDGNGSEINGDGDDDDDDDEEIILFTDSANSSCVIEEDHNKMDVDDVVKMSEKCPEDNLLASNYTNYNESVMVECNCVDKTENLIFDCDNNKYFKMETLITSEENLKSKPTTEKTFKMSLRNHSNHTKK